MEKSGKEQYKGVLEYSFDYERYIAGQLREIDDLDERRFAKRVLLDGLGAIIRQWEQKYAELEERVFREIEIPDGCYGIVSTVIKRRDYESTNGTFFPVFPADLQAEECGKLLSGEGYLYAGTIFLEADDSLCREFEALKALHGTAGRQEGRGEADFHIRQAKRYRDAVEGLYPVFLENRIPWKTVNIGYLDKFYDLYIPGETKDMQESKNARFMDIEDMDIDFGKFADKVRMGLIPLWNIEAVSFDSMDFMMPCIDGTYYEYEFDVGERNHKDGYLIEPRKEILEIRHEKDKIVIRSVSESFQKWGAWRIVQGETVQPFTHDVPLLGNRRKDSFIGRYAAKTGVQLLTKADLFRRIKEIDAGEWMEAVDCEILESCEGTDNLIEGSMNWFVLGELFPMDTRRILLIKFRARKPGYYMNDSMVRFIVSSLQMDIGEYRCTGIITGGERE